MPVEYCTAIEVVFSGAVTRKDLRPDDWGRHWPELAVEPVVQPVTIAPTGPLTTDPALEAELAKAEQAGLVLLPKKAPVWDGSERRRAIHRAFDVPADIASAGQGV